MLGNSALWRFVRYTEVHDRWVAFVISGTVTFLSLVLIPQFRRAVEDVASEVQAEVDRGVDETTRLLGGQS
jgi:hypothetical protein